MSKYCFGVANLYPLVKRNLFKERIRQINRIGRLMFLQMTTNIGFLTDLINKLGDKYFSRLLIDVVAA